LVLFFGALLCLFYLIWFGFFGGVRWAAGGFVYSYIVHCIYNKMAQKNKVI